MFEAARQALMHAEIAFFIRVTRSPRSPDSLHSRPDDWLDKPQARHLRARKSRFPAPYNQNKRGRRIHVEHKIHFVSKMRTFIVLTVVLAGAEPIRCFVTATTYGCFLLAQRELIQGVEEIGSRKISIQVVPGTTGGHRVMQDVRWCVAVKCEQTGCVVFDGRSNDLDERLRSPLIVANLDQVS